jgi:hypothetical protein
MGYMVKNEDSQKVISLTLTAEQLEVINGALEMYCIGLTEKNDPHLKYATNAHEAIINNLEWHFSEHKQEISDLFKELVDIANKSDNPFDVLRTRNGKPKKRVTEIGFRIKEIGGLWFLKKTTEEWLVAFNHLSYGRALYACWSGIVFDNGEISA